ncbi:hypothetical protein N7517_002246 [Penicillium concentricum]|uniref:CBM-cenC domain-containing protein n=1 Tax=Penicillium concentricum TaxID=293559 RepID=A0A9W9STM5_9EURO|nr:uncharacterized protein N7517_002246 [Penicillium concentricum]KAJ5384335.1 hypothetical protein N7517_002246 [Penicillium concentricum]
MKIQSHLMWLAHVLPAVALTITAPAQTTSSPAPLLGCGENLIKDVAFETIKLDDSLWTVLPPNGGAAVDGYLHLSAEAIQSQTLLTQTVTDAIAEESYIVSFDYRQTAGSVIDRTACTVNLILNGEDVGTSTLTAGSWKTISKQWTAASSEVDMLILIDCPDAAISGTTVDLNNISFKKSCGSSSSSSASVSTKTPSGLPVTNSTPTASSTSSSGHSSSEGSGSSSHISPASPSITDPITLTITITGSATPASSSAIESTTLETPTPDMTTSTVFTTRTATITACPSTVTKCPANDKTTHITTETILVSITVCPVADATTTIKGPSPTGPSGSGNGNDHTISTILSTRTVTLTQCPATVTDCPARDQTTHITTETVVAGTTKVPINTAVTTTEPGAVHTSPVVAGTGTTTIEGGAVSETDAPHVGGNENSSGVSTGEGEGSTGSGSNVSTGNNTGHLSNLPGITRTRISSAIPSSLTRIHSATVKASSATASSPTGAGAGAGSGSTTNSSPTSTSPAFNGASSFTVSSAVSALGAIAALALFL